jgi:tetratricopeptide (TPR) repeat protein
MHQRWFAAAPNGMSGFVFRLGFLLGILVSASSLAGADDAETAAKACLEGSSELLPQHRFREAADKYVCAADALARLPGHQERAARYRANAWLYRSWGTYTQKPITGSLGRRNLEDAMRQIQQSLPLWQEARFPVGERLAQAWLLYLNGVKLGAEGQYTSSNEAFDKAREMFTRIGEDVPAVREITDMLLSLAEDQTVFSEVMSAMNDPEKFESQGGYVNARLDDMKRRTPENISYYDSLAMLFRVERQFWEAGNRLEAWDYDDADAVLAEARKALDAAQPGGDVVPGEATRVSYRAVLAGWNSVVNAERHHATALRLLLAQGEPAKAKDELREGVISYREAQASFEVAGYPAGSIAAIRKTYERLRDRSEAIGRAFGPIQAMLAAGTTFFEFFFVTLGALITLRSRLPLSPGQTFSAALVVAIISTFGLRSPDVFQALPNVFQALHWGTIPK